MLSIYAPWCGLEANQRGVSDCAKLFLDKIGKILESISMEDQGHIFTIDLIFLGQHAMTRGPAFSEYF